jgi:hypothetical protein
MLTNLRETEVRDFEKGELPYSAGVRAKLLWKLGL